MPMNVSDLNHQIHKYGTAYEQLISNPAEIFREVPISFEAQGILLQGTLTYPKIDSQSDLKPGLLLLPGSGPTDRNGNQPGLNIDLLKQLAHRLAQSGFISLRFDKRSVASYKSVWPQEPQDLVNFFSWNNFSSDAARAFNALKGVNGIDPNQCGILGHSEGGLIAIEVAPSLLPSSLILMAAPGRSPSQIIQSQVAGLLERQNATPEQKQYFLSETEKAIHAIVKTGTIPNDIPPNLQGLFPPSASRYLQEMLPIDPQQKLSRYQGPVLILNGLLDLQVSPSADAQLLYESASLRSGTEQELSLIPNLSHNFKKIDSPNEPGLLGLVPDLVINKIVDWLKR